MKYLFMGVLILLSLTTYAQNLTAGQIEQTENAISSKGKYAILVKNENHLKAALLTGNELRNKHEKLDYHVVVCGKLVEQITTSDSLKMLIDDAVENQIHVLVCGLSIHQLSIDPKMLPERVSITKNGLIYLWGLQETGYKTIAL